MYNLTNGTINMPAQLKRPNETAVIKCFISEIRLLEPVSLSVGYHLAKRRLHSAGKDSVIALILLITRL